MDTIDLKQSGELSSLDTIALERVWRTIYRGDASSAARWFEQNGERFEQQLGACDPATEQGRAWTSER